MFTTNIIWTVFQAIVWFGVFTLIFQFHPWHALGLGILTMLLVSGLATMGVDSMLKPTPPTRLHARGRREQAGSPVAAAAPAPDTRPNPRRKSPVSDDGTQPGRTRQNRRCINHGISNAAWSAASGTEIDSPDFASHHSGTDSDCSNHSKRRMKR